MPITFSTEFGISKADITHLGVFDVILDVDTRVFIDPALLPVTSVPEFKDAKETVENYFSKMQFLHWF